MADRLADIIPATVHKQVSESLAARLNVLRHIRDSLADSQDKQKKQADAKCRGCVKPLRSDTKFYSMLKKLPTNVVSAVFKTKLRPRFIGQFTVVAKKGLAHTLNLPRKLRTHPVFYVGLLKPYRDPSNVNSEALATGNRGLPSTVVSEPGGKAGHPHGLRPTLMLEHGLDPTPTPDHGLALRRAHSGSYPMSLGDHSDQKHLLMLLLRYSDHHRRCSMSKETLSSM